MYVMKLNTVRSAACFGKDYRESCVVRVYRLLPFCKSFLSNLTKSNF